MKPDAAPKEHQLNVMPRKQIGLGRFLILSYLASLLLVLIYYVAPYFGVGLQIAIIAACVISVFVGFLGIVISLVISLSIIAFSREPEEKKRKSQRLVMKMLLTFVGITIGPSFVVMAIVCTVGILFGF